MEKFSSHRSTSLFSGCLRRRTINPPPSWRRATAWRMTTWNMNNNLDRGAKFFVCQWHKTVQIPYIYSFPTVARDVTRGRFNVGHPSACTLAMAKSLSVPTTLHCSADTPSLVKLRGVGHSLRQLFLVTGNLSTFFAALCPQIDRYSWVLLEDRDVNDRC